MNTASASEVYRRTRLESQNFGAHLALGGARFLSECNVIIEPVITRPAAIKAVTKATWRGLYSLCLCSLICSLPVYGASLGDLAESSFPEAVRVSARAGLITGYPDGTFRPDETVTRAELVATALRLADDAAADEVATDSSCFEDVKPNAWYASAVCRARASGLVDGVTTTRFEPEAPVSTAQALKILLLANDSAPEPETPGSPWYAPYLRRAEILGLNVPPARSAPLTRDELAQLLFSLLRTEAVFQDRVLPSSGCGTQAAPLPGTLTVGGFHRTFITSESGDGATPQRLVFAFHGRTSSNTEVRRYYGMEPYPDTLFVYPSGLAQDEGFSWSDTEGNPDYALFDALLDAFARDTCVDLTRVFVVGHSLGASFANSLGCARGDRIRGVGSLGGGVSAEGCRGKTAAMVFHNPADRLVPFSEGERVRDRFLAQNGLTASAVPTEPTTFNCERYGGATEHFPVVWCPHTFDYAYDGTYYPHNWPRGTGQVIMTFLNEL